MAIGLFAQNWEIFAKGLPIHNAASNLVHPTICSVHRCAASAFDEGSKESLFRQSCCLALFQFFVHLREGFDGEFQVFARMRC